MAYIGSTPTSQNFTSGTDYFSGTGSQTAYTLTRTVNSVNDIEVVINNVVQQPSTAYTLSGTTITFTSAPSSGTNNIYVRYLATNMQSFTVPANSITRSHLDSNLQAGFQGRNKIINGHMVVDQRNAGASVTPSSSTYSLDRWQASMSAASKFSFQQNAGSVTPPVGFTNYLGVTSTSAYSVGSTDVFLIRQPIEGFNTADLGFGTANAKTVTLSFWVQSSLTGTFGGALYNSDGTRSYPFTYTISSANTWAQISVTVAGDTSGTWVGATNGTGFYVSFSLGSGSTRSGTAGAWASAYYPSATGATSVVGTSGATFYITGVQLEEGTTATSFERETYSITLQKCQRYFTYRGGQNVYESAGIGQAYATTNGNHVFVAFPVSMRTTPTFTVSSASNWAVQAANGTALTCTAITFSAQSSNLNSHLDITVASGLSAGQAIPLYANNNINARLNFSAEL